MGHSASRRRQGKIQYPEYQPRDAGPSFSTLSCLKVCVSCAPTLDEPPGDSVVTRRGAHMGIPRDRRRQGSLGSLLLFHNRHERFQRLIRRTRECIIERPSEVLVGFGLLSVIVAASS